MLLTYTRAMIRFSICGKFQNEVSALAPKILWLDWFISLRQRELVVLQSIFSLLCVFLSLSVLLSFPLGAKSWSVNCIYCISWSYLLVFLSRILSITKVFPSHLRGKIPFHRSCLIDIKMTLSHCILTRW